MIQFIPTILESTADSFMTKRALLEPLVKRISLDFADNTLVPNQTVLPGDISPLSLDHEYDAHLMVSEPSQYFNALKTVGVTRVIVHMESAENMTSLIEKAKQSNHGVAITLNPETPIDELEPYLGQIEFVQIMAIHPGFGGLPFVSETFDRIRQLRDMAPKLDIAVDGAVRYDNAESLIDAGATMLMVGKGGYVTDDDVEKGITKWHHLIDTHLKGSHVS